MKLGCKKCQDNKINNYKYCSNCGVFLGESSFHDLIEPTIIKEKLSNDNKSYSESHPAYAQMCFSRRTSSGGCYSTLYGSSIQHQNTITLTIKPSEKQCSLYSERYYASNTPLIEVEMSQAQFSEAITSMNIGDGVPVTLRRIKNEDIPRCQEMSIQDKTQQNLDGKMKTFVSNLKHYEKRINELLTKKGHLKVDERKELKGIYSFLLTDISSNIPFLNECMQEALDKNVATAKADVESFFLTAITKLGIEALHDNKIESYPTEVIPQITTSDRMNKILATRK